MKKNKATQKQIAFMLLYRNQKEFTPAYAFVGEFYFPELQTATSNGWFLASYKCPTRLTDLFNQNPGMLERHYVRGKSGAEYYTYMLTPNFDQHIKDESLMTLLNILTSQNHG